MLLEFLKSDVGGDYVGCYLLQRAGGGHNRTLRTEEKTVSIKKTKFSCEDEKFGTVCTVHILDQQHISLCFLFLHQRIKLLTSQLNNFLD